MKRLLVLSLFLLAVPARASNVLINGTLAPNGTFPIVAGPLTHGSYSNATRPAANAFTAGTTIWNTDALTIQRTDGSAWDNVGSAVTDGPITGTGTSASHIACSTCIVNSGSYADPAWITSLAGSKITGTVSNATTAVSFSGSLSGAVTGTQGATTYAIPATFALAAVGATTASPSVILSNSTAATNTVDQYSPSLQQSGKVWNGSASATFRTRIQAYGVVDSSNNIDPGWAFTVQDPVTTNDVVAATLLYVEAPTIRTVLGTTLSNFSIAVTGGGPARYDFTGTAFSPLTALDLGTSSKPWGNAYMVGTLAANTGTLGLNSQDGSAKAVSFRSAGSEKSWIDSSGNLQWTTVGTIQTNAAANTEGGLIINNSNAYTSTQDQVLIDSAGKKVWGLAPYATGGFMDMFRRDTEALIADIQWDSSNGLEIYTLAGQVIPAGDDTSASVFGLPFSHRWQNVAATTMQVGGTSGERVTCDNTKEGRFFVTRATGGVTATEYVCLGASGGTYAWAPHVNGDGLTTSVGNSAYEATGVLTLGGASGTTSVAIGKTAGTIGLYGVTAVVQPTTAALTNSVTSGGSNDTIADFTNLTVYATDAATIRNDIYQLARKVAQLEAELQALGVHKH